MNSIKYKNYVRILKEELVPATGCTEPIALAFTAAKARDVLGREPERITVGCSGNMVKNAKAVTVPNSGGMRGIEAAVCLGAIVGDSEKNLEVLSAVSEADICKAQEWLNEKKCSCFLVKGKANLYIDVTLYVGEDSVRAVVSDHHTNVILVEKNGETIFSKESATVGERADRNMMSIPEIVEFADAVIIDDVCEVIGNQIRCNTAIANEGMNNLYGCGVSRAVLERESSIIASGRARAAAASEARMTGCPMPVVINSGSGNQGITVSVPLITVASKMMVDNDRLYRALVVSNLISIYAKHFIGDLSAFCGAVTAAAGTGAGLAYLKGASLEVIQGTVVNTLVNVGGIVCDGAKASCAAKIASALDAAYLGYCMAKEGRVFRSGDGLVGETPEETIRQVCYMGRVGMSQTDIEILKMMTGETKV